MILITLLVGFPVIREEEACILKAFRYSQMIIERKKIIKLKLKTN